MARKNRPLTFHLVALAMIAIVTGLLYANTLDVPFLFDDRPNIVDNTAIHASEISWEAMRRAAFEGHSSSRPIAFVSLALNHALGGLSPRGYHITNAAIHALTGGLVYALSLTLFGLARKLPEQRGVPDPRGSHWAALAAALLFVAHPVQTQAVTYVVQRMTSLATLFYLAGILAFLRARSATGPAGRVACYAASLALLGASLGSKQIAAVGPAAALLIEWLFYRNADLAWLRRNRIWMAASAVTLVGLAALFIGGDLMDGILAPYEIRSFTLGQRLLTQPRVLVFYASLLVWPLPSRLNLLHDFETSLSLIDPISTLASIALLAASAMAAIRFGARARLAAFGVAWFYLHLVIESSVIGLEMCFEHRLYLPSVGIFIAAAGALFSWRHKARAAAAVSLGLLLPLSAATVMRNETWRNAVGFWEDVVAKSPGDYRSHVNLGVELERAGQIDRAVERLQIAIATEPGAAYAHFNAGAVFERAGRSQQAIARYTDAVRIDENFVEARRALGIALAREGRLTAAEPHLHRALADKPTDAVANYYMGVVREQQGRLREAVAHLEAALREEPAMSDAANNLAWILATAAEPSLRDPQRARTLAEAGLRARPEHPGLLDTLGAAYAAAGLFEEATRVTERAAALARAADQQALARLLDGHAARYREGRALGSHPSEQGASEQGASQQGADEEGR